MTVVYLSLGSNVGQRRQTITEMVRRLKTILLTPVGISRIMETQPLEVSERQRNYLNCIVSGKFSGGAIDLLDTCQAIENALGRLRPHPHAPRSADIDILLFGNEVICEERLLVPHPRIMFRKFCLMGLQDINPDLIIPGCDRSVTHCLSSANEAIKNQEIKYIDESC